MNKYESRWNNAVKIATQINEYFDNGYTIIMDDGDYMTHRFEIREDSEDSEYNGIFMNISTNCCMMYFIKDIELDNGYFTSVSEYNEQFKDWKIINPKDIKKLKL